MGQNEKWRRPLWFCVLAEILKKNIFWEINDTKILLLFLPFKKQSGSTVDGEKGLGRPCGPWRMAMEGHSLGLTEAIFPSWKAYSSILHFLFKSLRKTFFFKISAKIENDRNRKPFSILAKILKKNIFWILIWCKNPFTFSSFQLGKKAWRRAFKGPP